MMASRRKQQDRARYIARRRSRERRHEAGERQLPNLAEELRISYERRYHDLVRDAIAEHPELIGIYECPDDVFYDDDRTLALKHAGLDGWERVLFTPTDDLDFSADPTTSAGGIINDNRRRPDGDSASGCTMMVTDGTVRRLAIIMRETVRGDGEQISDTTYAFKLAALLHELGHVTDFERQINYEATTGRLDLVGAEVFAHRYACDELLRRNCRLLLKHFLGGLERAARGDPSEYARIAARALIKGEDYKRYKDAVCGI